jgi:hypothetical protein
MVYIDIMPKRRTNIYLTEAQWRKLTALSQKTLAPVAALVRRAIDDFLRGQKAR